MLPINCISKKLMALLTFIKVSNNDVLTVKFTTALTVSDIGRYIQYKIYVSINVHIHAIKSNFKLKRINLCLMEVTTIRMAFLLFDELESYDFFKVKAKHTM